MIRVRVMKIYTLELVKEVKTQNRHFTTISREGVRQQYL